ncbi:MAG: small multi-drug export protein [Oscillospiraceae bacterium]|nr:small multi-drug export protein [Oscillospiraceae bacterium]MBQ2861730.1 small multi-drug export protein [Oscillospiraceae bacterium]MBQ2997768.1 small multi-drug export protein [Oscillospiraceae bacterium]MBQ3237022.1 small multi-drug export protein [Oscillospiraceae bacterium]MBQ3560326.1 small multi-drug export protein [Oscillospiraceae bacterium]
MIILTDYIYLFLISMVPLVELRGAMVYAAVAEMPFFPSLICCVAGNILPVPFLIKFAKTVLVYLAKIDKIGWIFQKIIDRGNKKAANVNNAELLGLFLFTALPVPGTGAWTASLIATLLQLRVVKSSFAILLGVITCGLIMGILSFGIVDLVA